MEAPANDRMYRFVVQAGKAFLAALRVSVTVSGTENLPAPDPLDGRSRRALRGSGAVVVITHFGYLDFAFAELVPWDHARVQARCPISKRAADHWFVSPFLFGLGHAVTDRKAGAPTYDDALAKLRAGEYMAILPEAGVSRSCTVRALETGAVRLAAEAGVPVVPVSVRGSHRLLTRGHGFSAPGRPPSVSTSDRRSSTRPGWTPHRRPRSCAGNRRRASTRASPTSRSCPEHGGCLPGGAAV